MKSASRTKNDRDVVLIVWSGAKLSVRAASLTLLLCCTSSRFGPIHGFSASTVPSSPNALSRTGPLILRPTSNLPLSKTRLSTTTSSSFQTNFFQPTSKLSSTKRIQNESTGNKRLGASMAFLTGWADVILHARLGTFCSMMTGNTLWLAKAMTDCRWTAVTYYLSVIGSYFAGLLFYKSLQKAGTATKFETKSHRRFLPRIATFSMVLFALSDLWMGFLPNNLATGFAFKWLPACFLACAFAMINGVGTDTAGSMTFVLTGHMTKMCQTIMDMPPKEFRLSTILQNRQGILTNMSILGSFFMGAVFANIRQKMFSSGGDFATIGILFGTLFLWKDSILLNVNLNSSTTFQDDREEPQESSYPHWSSELGNVSKPLSSSKSTTNNDKDQTIVAKKEEIDIISCDTIISEDADSIDFASNLLMQSASVLPVDDETINLLADIPSSFASSNTTSEIR